MDYALRFNGVDNHVSFASSMPTLNAGTNQWFIEFRVAVSSYPATGNWYFVGSSAGSASGICLRQASGDGALAVVVGGSFRFATNAGYVPNDGVAHTYRIEHDVGGATRIYKDGVMTHAITYTASASWTLGLFGNTSVGSVYFPFDLISVSMKLSDNYDLVSWNAALSNGTGLVLPSTGGLNNGTLVGTYVNDSQWVGLPEPTKYAMTTVGQGGTAYLAFPPLNVNQNANTFGVSKIRIEFKLDSFQGKAFASILGGSGSSQTYIRVNQATMALEWLFGNVLRITSPSNAITLGTRHVIEYTFNKATTTTTITLDGVELPSFAGGSTAGYDQVGRFHSVSTWTPELTLYALSIDGATYLTYQDAWDGTSEFGIATGTTWTSVAGNRVLTITESTGAADSWWLEDGAPPADTSLAALLTSQTAVGSSLSSQVRMASVLAGQSFIAADLTAGSLNLVASAVSQSFANGQLSTAIRMAATMSGASTVSATMQAPTAIDIAANLQGSSQSTAQLTTQVRLASGVSGRTNATAQLTTQVRLAANTASSTQVTALLEVPANTSLESTVQGRSTSAASMTTQIRMAALANSASTVTAVMATNAAQFTCAVSSSAAMSANLTAYKRVTFSVIGIPDGTFGTFARKHPAGPVVYDAPATYAAETTTLAVDAEVGDKIAGYVIDSLDPAESGSVLYGVVH